MVSTISRRSRWQRVVVVAALFGVCVTWLVGGALAQESSKREKVVDVIDIDDGLQMPVGSLDQAVKASGLVAVVVPTGQSQQEWFASDTLTATAYELRIERSLTGPQDVGETIWAYAPGGLVAETFEAQGSRRPEEGRATQLEESADVPHFEKGRRELVFLQFDSVSGKWASLPGGRFDLTSGKATLMPEQGGLGSADALPKDDWRRSVVGRSVEELMPIVARAK